MSDKKFKAISVPKVDADDYDVLVSRGIVLTTFIRNCFKIEADRQRAIMRKEKKNLSELES